MIAGLLIWYQFVKTTIRASAFFVTVLAITMNGQHTHPVIAQDHIEEHHQDHNHQDLHLDHQQAQNEEHHQDHKDQHRQDLHLDHQQAQNEEHLQDLHLDLDEAEHMAAQEQQQLLDMIEEQERAAANEARLMRLANIQASNLALRLKLDAGAYTPPPRTPAVGNASRSLSFSPATFTQGRYDAYKQAISLPVPRRRTMANLEEPTDDMAIPDGVCNLPVPMPKAFDGLPIAASPTTAAQTVQVRLVHFLADLEGFIHYYFASRKKHITPQLFLESAVRFLSGAAAEVYRNELTIAQQEHEQGGEARDIDWPCVRDALERRFGKPRSGHQVLATMMEMKQGPHESVSDFSHRFDELHMELTRQQLATRDLSATLFVRNHLLREKLQETVDSVDYFTREGIGAKESRKVLSALQLVATARESSLNASTSRSVHAAPQRQAPMVQHRPSQPSTSFRSAERAVDSVQVPDGLFRDRKAAGLCGKCGSEAHNTYTCKGPRTVTPLTNKRSGGRMNMILTDNQLEESKK
jgi:hypothetical protein